MSAAPIPVTVIGGYLGAGKTTLVNHLLRVAAGRDDGGPCGGRDERRRLAVLVNEFGELAIDADLIEAEDGDVVSLAGGCVCCSYGNDLMLTLDELRRRDPAPDHVLLEASGVAIPGAIAASLSLLPGYAREAVVVLVDVESVRARLADRYVGDTVARQLADADLLLLNKCDLVDRATLGRVRDALREHGDAPSVPASHSRVPLEVVLGADPRRRSADVADTVAAAARAGADRVPTGRDDDASTPVRTGADGARTARDGDDPSDRVDAADPSDDHRTRFVTRSFVIRRAVDPAALARALLEAEPALVRAKGFVREADGGVATLQIVGRRWTVGAGAPDDVEPGLVCIGVAALTDLAAAAALCTEDGAERTVAEKREDA